MSKIARVLCIEWPVMVAISASVLPASASLVTARPRLTGGLREDDGGAPRRGVECGLERCTDTNLDADTTLGLA